MDPPSSYHDLLDHLRSLSSDSPPDELDVRLIETFTAQLTEPVIPALLPSLVPLIISGLEHLRTDPTPLTTLLLRLITNVPYSALSPDPTQLLTTLLAPSPPIQNLGLVLLHKASETQSSAGILASYPDIIRQLVTLALAAEDTAIAEKAKDTLTALLKVDQIPSGGTGAVHKRVFTDPTIYREFYSLTSWTGTPLGGARRKTEAQGRLFGLLESLAAIDFNFLAHPIDTAVEAEFFTPATPEYGGPLVWAASHMAQVEEDVMMHLVQINFYATLLSVAPAQTYHFLQALDKTANLITLALTPEAVTPDPIEHMLLQSPASDFVKALITTIPSALESGGLQGQIIEAITSHLRDAVSEGPHAPTLTLLAALPAAAIPTSLPPLIPLSPPNPVFLKALTHLLPAFPAHLQSYTARHPDFYETLTKNAAIPALGAVALESLGLLKKLAEVDAKGMLNKPGVASFLVQAPTMFAGAGRDEEGWGWEVARRRWELVGVVLEGEGVEGGPWGERLSRRREGGVWARGENRVEVATMGSD